jgi:ribosomal protein S20
MKTLLKKNLTNLNVQNLKNSIKIIAKTAKKGAIHKKRASKLISKITKLYNQKS